MAATLQRSRHSTVMPHAVESVGAVRRRLRDELHRHGIPPPAVADATIVLSELLANALRHAAPLPDGGVRVVWEITDALVVLRVTDGGASRRRPRVTAAAPHATGGRGLAIVDELAASWDVSTEPDGGSTVCAAIPVRGGSPH